MQTCTSSAGTMLGQNGFTIWILMQSDISVSKSLICDSVEQVLQMLQSQRITLTQTDEISLATHKVPANFSSYWDAEIDRKSSFASKK